MTRGDLKMIYDKVSDDEKKAWAKLANYVSYEGLYGYLRSKPDSVSYEKVVDALVIVIGQDRLDKFISELRAIEMANIDIEEHKKIVIKAIFGMQDKDKLEKIRRDIVSACDSQLLRIEVESNIV